MKNENKFKAELKADLKKMFPDGIIKDLDPFDLNGIPDLLILVEDRWATLECKKYKNAKRQPNQPFWVNKMNEMSFSRFIEPENREEVLHELQRALQLKR